MTNYKFYDYVVIVSGCVDSHPISFNKFVMDGEIQFFDLKMECIEFPTANNS